MYCFFCGVYEIKVIDFRFVFDGLQVCCWCECLKCSDCFIIFEVVELLMLKFVKQDGMRQFFDEEKLCGGMQRVLEKCLVSVEVFEIVILVIKYNLQVLGE